MNNENDTPSVGDVPKTTDENIERLEAALKGLNEILTEKNERRRHLGLPPLKDLLLGND